jgi:hypothetical protein
MGYEIVCSQLQFIILKQIHVNIDKEYECDRISKAAERIHEGKINLLQHKDLKIDKSVPKKRIPKW